MDAYYFIALDDRAATLTWLSADAIGDGLSFYLSHSLFGKTPLVTLLQRGIFVKFKIVVGRISKYAKASLPVCEVYSNSKLIFLPKARDFFVELDKAIVVFRRVGE